MRVSLVLPGIAVPYLSFPFSPIFRKHPKAIQRKQNGITDGDRFASILAAPPLGSRGGKFAPLPIVVSYGTVSDTAVVVPGCPAGIVFWG